MSVFVHTCRRCGAQVEGDETGARGLCRCEAVRGRWAGAWRCQRWAVKNEVGAYGEEVVKPSGGSGGQLVRLVGGMRSMLWPLAAECHWQREEVVDETLRRRRPERVVAEYVALGEKWLRLHGRVK